MRELLRTLGAINLDGYTFLRPMTGGKMSSAAIYENQSGEFRVVKFLIMPRNDEELERFATEAKLLSDPGRFQSDFLVGALSEVRRVDPYPVYYFMMPYVSGMTLRQLLAEKPAPWNAREALGMILRVAATLSDAHAKQIVHKDLHAANIMVDDALITSSIGHVDYDPGIRILDFGLAADCFSAVFQDRRSTDLRLVGAVSTWSPEYVFSSKPLTPAHDVWALGALLYHLLTGTWAFLSKNLGEYVDQIRTGVFANEPLFNVGASSFVRHIVKRTFATDPESRVGTGGVIAMCSDYVSYDIEDVLNKDTELRDLYLKHDGQIGLCFHCGNIVPISPRCTKCGFVPDDGYAHFLSFQS